MEETVTLDPHHSAAALLRGLGAYHEAVRDRLALEIGVSSRVLFDVLKCKAGDDEVEKVLASVASREPQG